MDLDDIFSNFDRSAKDAPSSDSAKKSSSKPSEGKRKKARVEPEIEETVKEVDTGNMEDGSSADEIKPAESSAVVASKKGSAPAKVYPFKLDKFQQDAVDCIEKGESVLVAAHTSAGKTAVAEYAIAKSLKNKQRVIYTSPIKALSNQKYRDLQEEFGDVGLMTGDMTINPNAACLIMTTEILRSMLYRGSEVMREVAWVIYDEVHYMRDKERGVVWEESIILLPHKVRFVFLSATIPNAPEFVGWVSKLHHQPCHVVYTDYRPVPLQHFVFPAAAEGLFLVVDEKGNFKEDSFQKAMSTLQAPSELQDNKSKGGKKIAGAKSQQGSDLFKIVRLIMDRDLDPCIVFSFSKKECETYALQMARLDFNSEEEKQLVSQVFENALESLSEEDRALPQIITILPLLKRGIGIHHGGLLPILKEVLEILFQEGLIKCLFATETFSIGINMPAKTVVFTATRKFDGQDFRWITPGEYIQMSGRAGRRGKDDRGIVIQMLDEKMAPEITKNMIYGASDPLYSSYQVSYNMLLNMLRVEDADPENLLRSSFHQYQQEQNIPMLETQAAEMQKEADFLEIDDEEIVSEYYTTKKLLIRCKADISQFIRDPERCEPFLMAGRVVFLSTEGNDWGWGVLLGYTNKTPAQVSGNEILGYSSADGDKKEGTLIMKVLMTVEKVSDEVELEEKSGQFSIYSRLVPRSKKSKNLVTEVIQVSLTALCDISAIKLQLPKDFNRDAARKAIGNALIGVEKRFEDKGIPLLDPVKDIGITSDSFQGLLNREIELKSRLGQNALTKQDDYEIVLQKYSTRMDLLEKARALRYKAHESQSIAMKDELRRMKRVLKRLGYISPEGVLGTKGRFSCELSTADELVVTDMIFDGIFSELSIEQAVALLSCFVHKEPSKGDSKLAPELDAPFQQLQSISRNIAKVCIEAKIVLDEEEFVNSFNPGMMSVTYAWCSGSSFAEICSLTDIFEGSIIRNIRRLEELLRQLASASLAIGNQELKILFEKGADKIRRGVVFAASLYI